MSVEHQLFLSTWNLAIVGLLVMHLNFCLNVLDAQALILRECGP